MDSPLSLRRIATIVQHPEGRHVFHWATALCPRSRSLTGLPNTLLPPAMGSTPRSHGMGASTSGILPFHGSECGQALVRFVLDQEPVQWVGSVDAVTNM